MSSVVRASASTARAARRFVDEAGSRLLGRIWSNICIIKTLETELCFFFFFSLSLAGASNISYNFCLCIFQYLFKMM